MCEGAYFTNVLLDHVLGNGDLAPQKFGDSVFLVEPHKRLIRFPLVEVLVGMVLGGYACLQHLAMRAALWWNDSAPLRYVRFLDYAAERVFLRKVGGGYVFVHRLLQEWFARSGKEGRSRARHLWETTTELEE